jgi:putative PIN family toxin of toxin-antitoxin system
LGKKEDVTRLVLDTNVLVSALLFRSEVSGLFDAWRHGRFRIAASGPILDEFARVLSYPKFRLSEREASAVMERPVLPFCDQYESGERPRVCADPDDDKFFHCALAARAAALVSGDRAVLALGPCQGRVRVLSVKDALARYCR